MTLTPARVLGSISRTGSYLSRNFWQILTTLIIYLLIDMAVDMPSYAGYSNGLPATDRMELKLAPIDPSWIVSGSPIFYAGAFDRSPDTMSGIWECIGPGKFIWHYSVDETIYVLEGSAHIEYLDKQLTLRPGDSTRFVAGTTAVWLVTAGLVRERNPELARALIWAWDQLGRPAWDQHDCGFRHHAIAHADLLAQLPPHYVPKHLKSVWLPGFGAVMRAHPGDPQETMLAYRQGYLTSHSDANQGDFVLYSKGAPLSTLSLSAYAIHNGSPFAKLHKEFAAITRPLPPP